MKRLLINQPESHKESGWKGSRASDSSFIDLYIVPVSAGFEFEADLAKVMAKMIKSKARVVKSKNEVPAGYVHVRHPTSSSCHYGSFHISFASFSTTTYP